MIYDLRKPDLSNLEIGDGIITSRSCLWEMIAKNSWLDKQNGLTWLPEEPGQFTHYKALELQNESKRLPTKEEFEEAEEHGIREILDMEGKFFWSASVHPDYEDNAYGFDGDYGGIGTFSRDSISGSVRCVAGR